MCDGSRMSDAGRIIPAHPTPAEPHHYQGGEARPRACLSLAPRLRFSPLHGKILPNTGSLSSCVSHRLKNEETLLNDKQGKKKRKKARMMCFWTTTPSQFT